MVSKTLPVRIEEDLISRLDWLADALTRRAAGAKVSRSSAMRVAVERGLESLEGELGAPTKLKPKPKKK
jgi:predicted transcriptional regulator